MRPHFAHLDARRTEATCYLYFSALGERLPLTVSAQHKNMRGKIQNHKFI